MPSRPRYGTLKDELGDSAAGGIPRTNGREAGHFNFFDVAAAYPTKWNGGIRMYLATLKRQRRCGQIQLGNIKARAAENQQNRPQTMRPACSMMYPPPCPACHAPSNCNAALPTSAFDWSEAAPIFAKLDEEIEELRRECAAQVPTSPA
ncbi:MAG: hypothetical protein CM15mP21_7920 [Hyphomicrobiales bacterium]|nr:MAG: hypothetical protein CM15mP21_7920 [Hyphomicrobiales bacterium]